MRNYARLLNAGNKAQLEKLEMNEHKPGLDEISMTEAVNGIREEYLELLAAYPDDIKYNKKDLQHIRHEAADLANYCHMLILSIDREIEYNDQ